MARDQKFLVIVPDYGRDWDDAWEFEKCWDANDAAQKAVERYCQDGSYPSSPLTTLVRDADNITQQIDVAIEFEPVFTGHAVRQGPKQCKHTVWGEEDGFCYGCSNKFPELVGKKRERLV
jgi:hypothetical protein